MIIDVNWNKILFIEFFYNQFYQNVKILPETDGSIRSNRLVLSKSVASVIQKSLEIFGIHSPTRMWFLIFAMQNQILWK